MTPDASTERAKAIARAEASLHYARGHIGHVFNKDEDAPTISDIEQAVIHIDNAVDELKAYLHPVALTSQQEQIEFQRLRQMSAKELFEEVNLWRLRYECVHMEADKAEAKLAEQSAALAACNKLIKSFDYRSEAEDEWLYGWPTRAQRDACLAHIEALAGGTPSSGGKD